MTIGLAPHVVDELAWLADALAGAPGVRHVEVGQAADRGRVLVIFDDGSRRAVRLTDPTDEVPAIPGSISSKVRR